MKMFKKIVGLLCLVAGPLVALVLVVGAVKNIDPAGTTDISKPVPWIIIIAIFTPISVGLSVFGWYAWKGEYDRLPERSEEL
ncbi:MAG TPA: hypothetical protein VD996_08385 [Chitinophagaceae bacterium]|nr:hypothetical protein [Chitinophagaceae bacterium]